MKRHIIIIISMQCVRDGYVRMSEVCCKRLNLASNRMTIAYSREIHGGSVWIRFTRNMNGALSRVR